MMIQDPQGWEAELLKLVHEAREGSPGDLAVLAQEYGSYQGAFGFQLLALGIGLGLIAMVAFMVAMANRKKPDEAVFVCMFLMTPAAVASAIVVYHAIPYISTFVSPAGSLINSAVN